MPPALLAAGDYDADGHADLVLTTPGTRTLVWLRGNGRGEFSLMPEIALPGSVTTLLGGEVNRPDGLADILVAVESKAVALLLMYQGPQGALQSTPDSIALPAAATSLAVGRLRNDLYHDVAIAAGQRLLVLTGRDRKLSHDAQRQAEVTPLQMEERVLSSPVLAVVAGDFSGQQQTEIAWLCADGSVQVLAPLPRATTEASFLQQATVRTIAQVSPASQITPLILCAARLSNMPFDQLLLPATAGSGLQIITPVATSVATPEAALPRTLSLTGTPQAVLPLRLNRDALTDLVVLQTGKEPLLSITTEAQITYLVTNANAGGAGSLDQAIRDANANPGLDQIHFNIPGAGPFTLNAASEVTDAVVIDGTTQPGYAGKPLIAIGPNGSRTPNGLIVAGGNSTIRGLRFHSVRGDSTVTQGGGNGLWLKTQGNNIVEGNWIGLNAQGGCTLDFRGDCPTGNTFGLRIENSSNNLIGGTTSQARNVISSTAFLF